ncbi:MAG: hypothetical protein HKN03_08660 [Acidimicrobiales bacterium]|nr:hypothetical protein [Acidimicrobiales bacterium]
MARRYLRRAFSIPLSLLLAPLMLVLSPLVIPLLALIDIVSGAPRRLPLARIGLMAVAFACHEWYAMALYLRALLGSKERRLDRLQEGMGTWSMSLIKWAGHTLGAKLDWGDPATMPKGYLLLLSRHASNVDAIIPSALFPHILERPAHYVLKRELRWISSMDLFGPPLGNYFVARGGNTGAELQQLRALGEHVRPEGALVIFPEGTFATPAARKRIRASLERRNEKTALALTDELRALLPPKPSGVHALLRARPDARPMILAHRGLDGVASMAGMRANVPLRTPVVVRWWPTEPVPTGEAAQELWLQDEWRRLDRWVTSDSLVPPPEAPTP